MESLVLQKAPPLDPAWLQYEKEADLLAPRPVIGKLERQPIYAAQCRELDGSMMSPGAPYHHLSQGITRSELTVVSTKDEFQIPVLKYELAGASEVADKPWSIIIYYHGGGLHVGEADSEDLQCRRILKESGLPNVVLYSVGYRLKPKYTASLAVADCMDAFNWIVNSSRQLRSLDTRHFIIGSSSGGELAALVSQSAPKGSINGVVLRCPVTSDAFNGPEYVPQRLRHLHTSAWDMSFSTSLLGVMAREVPRDGLERMPLEADEEELRGLPRTWIQVCSNDMLYSDGLCYAKALQDAAVDVKLEVVQGWPHTFWLKAPQLPQAFAADQAMLKGLAWLAGEDESIVL